MPTYPTEPDDSILAFNSYEEAATFWDTHDFTAFWQEGEPVKLRLWGDTTGTLATSQ